MDANRETRAVFGPSQRIILKVDLADGGDRFLEWLRSEIRRRGDDDGTAGVPARI